MSGGGKSGKAGKAEVPVYLLSFHVGICTYGEDISLLAAYAGEKKFIEGNYNEQRAHVIDNKDLFGGLTKEGGLSGLMSVLPGKPEQMLYSTLAYRIGGTPNTTPGYRGIFSLWFTGRDKISIDQIGSPPGFRVGSGNPYLKPLSFRMWRPSKGLNPKYEAIVLTERRDTGESKFESLPEGQRGYVMRASNPAHILYEIYTNTSWGDGRSPLTIDKDSFEVAAQTLYNERFGISFQWTRQSPIKQIVSEIVDHIQASIYDDPETGMLTIKLLRDDYNVNDLPVVDTSNAKLSHFKRKLWGEVSSEVVVTWTNPVNESEMTITAHNISASQAQGGNPVSTSRNFYMVRDADLASRLAARELAMLSFPLAACDAVVHRDFSRVSPGDVVKLNWPEHGIKGLAMRVMEVLPGSSQSAQLTLKLQEDIFGRKAAQYLRPVTSSWKPDNNDPKNIEIGLTTLPGYMAAQVMGKRTVGELEYPTAVTGITANKPSNSFISYEVRGPRETTLGYSPFSYLRTNIFPTTALTGNSITRRQIESSVRLNTYFGRRPTVNEFVIFGSNFDEICVISGFDPDTDLFTLRRGCLDTVPLNWPENTKVTVVSQFKDMTDAMERSVGEQVTYKILPSTYRGTLSEDMAVETSVTLTDRAYLPLRPANMMVNGNPHADVANAPTSGPIPVTWSNRNRITESQRVMLWTDASVAPETGQVTNVLVTRGGTLFKKYAGITGDRFNIPRADLSGVTNLKIELESERDGFLSLTRPWVLLNRF